MTSVFTTISFIKTVSGTSALAAHDPNDRTKHNNVGYGKVTVIQAVLLNLKTIEELPSIYDLPSCPPFGNYSALCKSSEINKDATSYFTLGRRTYNPVTSNYSIAEVACSYNSGNSRYANVAKAIESTAVFSVSGKLYGGKNMVQIITSDIEWNNVYPATKTNNASSSEPGSDNRKRRNQDLMNYESRCQGSSSKRSAKTREHNQRTPINIEEETVVEHPEERVSTES
ncbi:2190_t:CDS:2 [Entrophospora sp. SA101]|nr:2190_t:CDS:2 [Entrophospora sp. SA101]